MHLMKRLFPIISALCAPLSAFAAMPNIILMMGDDHGWEETRYNGHPHVTFPVLPTVAALAGQSLPARPVDGIDLAPVFDDKMSARPTSLQLWDFNFRHPSISDGDCLGPRSIIEGDHKLVIHERNDQQISIELFDLKADPAEKTNLAGQKPELARKLQSDLRKWQDSVLKSLTGADYSNP